MFLRNLAIIFLLLLLPTEVFSLQANYASSFKEQLRIIIDRHPKYYMSGYQNESQGLDCSGYLYLAAKRAALPVRRVTAFNMRYGLGGWLGNDIPLDTAIELDLVWWTWTYRPSRGPFEHVGAFLEGQKSHLLEVTESGSRGVTVTPLKGVLLTDVSAVRRLSL